MCKAKAKEEPPCLYTEERARGDYNARLGYGTDQGRWLVEQVCGQPPRQPRPPLCYRPAGSLHRGRLLHCRRWEARRPTWCAEKASRHSGSSMTRTTCHRRHHCSGRRRMGRPPCSRPGRARRSSCRRSPRSPRTTRRIRRLSAASQACCDELADFNPTPTPNPDPDSNPSPHSNVHQAYCDEIADFSPAPNPKPNVHQACCSSSCASASGCSPGSRAPASRSGARRSYRPPRQCAGGTGLCWSGVHRALGWPASRCWQKANAKGLVFVY